MPLCAARAAWFCWSFCVYLAAAVAAEAAAAVAASRAYALHLSTNSVTSVRVLGASIRATGSTADLVLLAAPTVNEVTLRGLAFEGWRVKKSASADNNASCSAIAAWALTEYSSVILLSEDSYLLENVDELFDCDAQFCAVMTQSELVSATTIVLQPSLKIHEAMHLAVAGKPALCNSVANSVNHYFGSAVAACPLYDPLTPPATAATGVACRRLPTRYSGDLLLVILNGGLSMVRTQNEMADSWWSTRSAKIIEYNLAGLKPAMWLFAPFLGKTEPWQKVCTSYTFSDHLPTVYAYLVVFLVAGRCHAQTYIALRNQDKINTSTTTKLLWPVIYIAVGVLLAYKSSALIKKMHGGISAAVKSTIGSVGGIRRVPTVSMRDPHGPIFTICSLVCGIIGIAAVIRIAAAQVSQAVTAGEAWFTFTMWSTSLALFYWSVYMCITFEIARQTAEQYDDISRSSSCMTANDVGKLAPTRESLISLIVWAGLLLLLPYLSGVTSSEGGSGLLAAVVVVAIVLHTLMCILRLPVLWYSAGIRSSDVAQ
jgi:hypothetical protein